MCITFNDVRFKIKIWYTDLFKAICFANVKKKDYINADLSLVFLRMSISVLLKYDAFE